MLQMRPYERTPRGRRLNYRLNVACEADIDALCTEECSPYLGQACGGRVLRCLTEKQDAITSKACQARARRAAAAASLRRCLPVTDDATLGSDPLSVTCDCCGELKCCIALVLGCTCAWAATPDWVQSVRLGAQDEVFYFEKMEVNDFRNDVLLAEACRSDVDKFCRHVEPGALATACKHHFDR